MGHFPSASGYSISTGQQNEIIANMHMGSVRNDSKILEQDDDVVITAQDGVENEPVPHTAAAANTGPDPTKSVEDLAGAN